MTSTEIKKAFEQFKKELKKETGICGGFVMNAKQIENRTATKLVCNMNSYEREIANYESWINDTVSESNKAYYEKYIAFNREQLAIYGTKMNYIKEEVERITNSKAFEKFSATIGGVKVNTEIKQEYGIEYMHIRFNY